MMAIIACKDGGILYELVLKEEVIFLKMLFVNRGADIEKTWIFYLFFVDEMENRTIVLRSNKRMNFSIEASFSS